MAHQARAFPGFISMKRLGILPFDQWKDRYNRHVKQSVCGFYTPPHVPYASVGEVCLDMRDLVISTVGLGQSSEKVILNLSYFDTINCLVFAVLVMKNVQFRSFLVTIVRFG